VSHDKAPDVSNLGWSTGRVQDLCVSVTDGDHQPPPKALDGVPFLVIGNVSERGKLDFTDTRFVSLTYYRSLDEARRPKRGDVLYSVTGSFGIPVLVDVDQPFCVQRHLAILRPAKWCDSKYLCYALAAPATFAQASSIATGTAQKTVPLKGLRAIEVQVAPQNEQRRIVEVLDSYLTRLDAAVEGLKRVGGNLKRYRASVLKAAVEGRLVPTEAQLAEKEGRAYEPAAILLERILAERRRRWEEAELAKMKAKGEVAKNEKWRQRYEGPIPADSAALPDLPAGWCWATLDQLSWSSGYGTSVRCDEDAQGIPVLRIPNVSQGRIDLSDLKFATQDLMLAPGDEVSPGDFLTIRTNGSRSLIGRAAFVPAPLPGPHFFASYLIRFRLALPSDDVVVGRWLSHVWESPPLREQLERKAATSAGQYNLAMSALLSYAVPLPPATEINRLVDAVEDYITLADQSARSIVEKTASIARLRQSILKWAFEGKLVDQNPNDEPASALIARIKAERERQLPAITDGRRTVRVKSKRAEVT
jgi:type I restriction enzyme S subunit